ncbi:hypothetical protein [Kitasatospora sp. NPDC093558]
MVAGSGVPLFRADFAPHAFAPHAFALTESRIFEHGNVILAYARVSG